MGGPLRRSNFWLCFPILFVATAFVWAESRSGVVVEKVSSHSAAEAAGLVPGDVLLSWSRGSENGVIESPFTPMLIEIEQAPLGVVSVEGLRGTEKHLWQIGQEDWGLETRPNFASSAQSLYRRATAQVSHG